MFENQILNLYLVRHGETEGNVNRELYVTKADHAMRLTEKGKDQAEDAGRFLLQHLLAEQAKDPENFGAIRVWYSPYYRARETANGILYHLGQGFDHSEKGILTYREDAFLFEQKAGLFDGLHETGYAKHFPREAADNAKHVEFNGRTYARSPLGDSRMDVAIRAKPFFGTILRDKETRNIRHVVVISHGVTVRAMTMGWMRYAPEWFDAEKNPGNTWTRHIHGNQSLGYTDEGYIFGHKAPLRDVMATQKHLDNADQIIMLAPQRRNGIVPFGVRPIDPFAQPRLV